MFSSHVWHPRTGLAPFDMQTPACCAGSPLLLGLAASPRILTSPTCCVACSRFPGPKGGDCPLSLRPPRFKPMIVLAPPRSPPAQVEIMCQGVSGTMIIREQRVMCHCSECQKKPQEKRIMSCTQVRCRRGSSRGRGSRGRGSTRGSRRGSTSAARPRSTEWGMPGLGWAWVGVPGACPGNYLVHPEPWHSLPSTLCSAALRCAARCRGQPAAACTSFPYT